MLRRDDLNELMELTASQLKVLIYFYLTPPPLGKNKGKTVGYIRDFASDLEIDRKAVYRSIKTLDKFLDTKLSRNRWKPCKITVKNRSSSTHKIYSEKLRDPRWQKKRLEILNRDYFECRVCGTKEIELHVHHTKYLKGKKPWEYPNDLLLSLCKKCHFKNHDN